MLQPVLERGFLVSHQATEIALVPFAVEVAETVIDDQLCAISVHVHEGLAFVDGMLHVSELAFAVYAGAVVVVERTAFHGVTLL